MGLSELMAIKYIQIWSRDKIDYVELESANKLFKLKKIRNLFKEHPHRHHLSIEFVFLLDFHNKFIINYKQYKETLLTYIHMYIGKQIVGEPTV